MTKRDAKAKAVAARIKEIAPNAEVLAGMWNEQSLDHLILILGIGFAVLDGNEPH